MNREDAIKTLESLPETARISVARLQPSDVIVIESTEIVSDRGIEHIKQALSQIWPDNKIVVLDRTLSMRVANGA